MNNPYNNPQGRSQSPQGGGGDDRSFPKIVPRGSPNEAIVKSAEEWGRRWGKDGATSAQLRRYFGEVKRLDMLVQQEGWKKHALSVKLLKAKAAYALRQEGKKRLSMVTFIQECVDKTNTIDDFNHFVLYFEAALGFAYGAGLSDKER